MRKKENYFFNLSNSLLRSKFSNLTIWKFPYCLHFFLPANSLLNGAFLRKSFFFFASTKEKCREYSKANYLSIIVRPYMGLWKSAYLGIFSNRSFLNVSSMPPYIIFECIQQFSFLLYSNLMLFLPLQDRPPCYCQICKTIFFSFFSLCVDVCFFRSSPKLIFILVAG